MNVEELRAVLAHGGGVIDDDRLGKVSIRVKSQARRFIARWEYDGVSLTVPSFSRAEDVLKAVDELAPKLLRRRKVLSYSPDSLLEFDGFDVAIGVQTLSPDKVTVRWGSPHASLGVGVNRDFTDPSTVEMISRGLKIIAHNLAPDILIPRAKELAEGLGCRPAGWVISRGTHILGQCSSKRIIKLSSANLFLPTDLRDYIIFHELAHLKEMNHSPRFHAICDEYCGGREADFIRRLRTFPWPILR